MLTIIISLILAVVGIVVYNYAENNYSVPIEINIGSFAIALLCSGIFIGSIILATTNNITKETNFQNMLYEKQVIEYRIENKESNIVGNEMLYNDIVAFNNKLRTEKKWATNPWINVFWNDMIASIDYIELE